MAEFEEFVASRGGVLLRFALMLCGDPHLAEDLVQSALARAYRRWRRIAATERPEAYVKKMIVNEHLGWRRLRSSGERPVAAPPDGPAEADPAEAGAERDAVWGLLAGLPRKQRAVLVLRFYEDLADEQIAELLGCGVSTVRSNAARALAALRQTVPTLELEARR